MNRTVSIQIGNLDDRLTQKEWADFCSGLLVLSLQAGEIHFSGGAPTNTSWQNFCVVVSMDDDADMFEFMKDVIELRKKYKQDSVAWLEGSTYFV